MAGDSKDPQPDDLTHEMRQKIESLLRDYQPDGLFPARGALSLASCGIGDETMPWVEACLKKLTNLHTLFLSGNPLGDESLKSLVGLSLATLDLTYCVSITDDGVAPLKKLSLNALTLKGCVGIGDRVLEHLEGMPLTALHVGQGPNITDVGLRHLIGMPLSNLNLDQCEITDRGLQHLSDLRLTALNLRGCTGVNDDALMHVSEMPLTALNLSGCWRITGGGLKYLDGLPLKELDISGCLQIGNGALEHLKTLPLTKLNLGWCNGIIAGELQHLARLTSLTSLILTECRGIADGDLQHLAGLTSLTTLDLRGCMGIAAGDLLHLSGLTSLTELNLDRCTGIAGRDLQHLQDMPLTTLDLGECTGIVGGDLRHLAGLTSLTTLNLTGCTGIVGDDLRHLAGLTSLTTLNLTGCTGITDAAGVVGLIQKLLSPASGRPHGTLRRIDVRGVPLRFTDADGSFDSIPETYLNTTDPQVLLKRLLEFKPGAKDARGRIMRFKPLLAVRMSIVGHKGIGKSQLWGRMQNGGVLGKQLDKTKTWELKTFGLDRAGPNGEAVQVRFFDLGGDLNLHGGHRTFFGGKRCLWLIMVNASQPRSKSLLDYWLRIVRAYGNYNAKGHNAEGATVTRIAYAPCVVILSWRDQGVDDSFHMTVCNRESLRGQPKLNLQLVRNYWEPEGRQCGGASSPQALERLGKLTHADRYEAVREAVVMAIENLHPFLWQAFRVEVRDVLRECDLDDGPLGRGPIGMEAFFQLLYDRTEDEMHRSGRDDIALQLGRELGYVICPERDAEDARKEEEERRSFGDRPRGNRDWTVVPNALRGLVFGVKWISKVMYEVVSGMTFKTETHGIVSEDSMMEQLGELVGDDKQIAGQVLEFLKHQRLVFDYKTRTGPNRFIVVDRLKETAVGDVDPQKNTDTNLVAGQEALFGKAAHRVMKLELLLSTHLPQFIGMTYAVSSDRIDPDSEMRSDRVVVTDGSAENSARVLLTADLNAGQIHARAIGGTEQSQNELLIEIRKTLRDVTGEFDAEFRLESAKKKVTQAQFKAGQKQRELQCAITAINAGFTGPLNELERKFGLGRRYLCRTSHGKLRLPKDVREQYDKQRVDDRNDLQISLDDARLKHVLAATSDNDNQRMGFWDLVQRKLQLDKDGLRSFQNDLRLDEVIRLLITAESSSMGKNYSQLRSDPPAKQLVSPADQAASNEALVSRESRIKTLQSMTKEKLKAQLDGCSRITGRRRAELKESIDAGEPEAAVNELADAVWWQSA